MIFVRQVEKKIEIFNALFFKQVQKWRGMKMEEDAARVVNAFSKWFLFSS